MDYTYFQDALLKDHGFEFDKDFEIGIDGVPKYYRCYYKENVAIFKWVDGELIYSEVSGQHIEIKELAEKHNVEINMRNYLVDLNKEPYSHFFKEWLLVPYIINFSVNLNQEQYSMLFKEEPLKPYIMNFQSTIPAYQARLYIDGIERMYRKVEINDSELLSFSSNLKIQGLDFLLEGDVIFTINNEEELLSPVFYFDLYEITASIPLNLSEKTLKDIDEALGLTKISENIRELINNNE